MTKLEYLKDTYLFESKSNIKATGKNEKGDFIICNETIFYPQGGGQASDIGLIMAKQNSFHVEHTAYFEGEVYHYGHYENDAPISLDEPVKMEINKNNRIKNAQLHTAGHLISHIAEHIQNDLMAIKGYHFPNGAYVELEGIVNDKEYFLKTLQDTIINELEKSSEVKTETISLSEMKERGCNIPENIPLEKPSRIASIGNYVGAPCGGTHVKDLSEIKEIKITKIKNKKGNTKISYTVL